MWIVGAAFTFLVLGAVAQFVCVRRDRQRFPPIGRYVAGLHVHQAGTHGPAIVFEAGIAATCLNWIPVQAALSARAQTYSYDRAGLGWSPRAGRDRSLHRITGDLHRLIHALGLPRPVVLVGHSFGTYVVRVYAHRFPDDVAALVLVDPVMPEEYSAPALRTRLRLLRATLLSYVAAGVAACGVARLGLWRLMRRGGGNPGPLLGLHPSMRRIAAEVSKLPADVTPAIRARWSEAGFYRELAAAIRSLPRCAAEAAAHPVPSRVPVIVLSGAHQSLETLAAHEARAARHIVVEGSAHWIHLDQPALVADVVLSAAGPPLKVDPTSKGGPHI